MVTFDSVKRAANLTKHGIDLALCGAIFESPMQTFEDTRQDYGEQRLCSLGWLDDRVVFLVWVDRELPHVISCRKATKYEVKQYFTHF